jgi:hypothetical protein
LAAGFAVDRRCRSGHVRGERLFTLALEPNHGPRYCVRARSGGQIAGVPMPTW